MLLKTFRPCLTASTIVAKLSSARTMSLAPLDTSVPVIPMPIPISACFKLGASFTPSPVMATILSFACQALTIDPERPEAKEAIKEAHSAGIRTVMITGDFQVTAQAIAERLGILKLGQDKRVITGAQLDELSDDYFKKHVSDYSVYARVSPEHKVRIISQHSLIGHVIHCTEKLTDIIN